MRESRSRPRLSVPSRYFADIGSHTSPTISALEYGEIQGAKIAQNRKAAVRISPTQALTGICLNAIPCFSPLFVVAPAALLRMPQSWIGQDRRNVSDDVQQYVDRGKDQAHSLHHRHVALGHMIHKVLPHAGVDEDYLDDDDAHDQIGKVQHHDVYHRRDGVRQRMLADDVKRFETLEFGGLD